MSLFYINKKGKKIELTLTDHAKRRFKQRYKKLYPDKNLDSIKDKIEKIFSKSTLITNISKRPKLATRLKRYGEDTLYFKTSQFAFVVQNSKIVTIEICAVRNGNSMRFLNKRRNLIEKEKSNELV